MPIRSSSQTIQNGYEREFRDMVTCARDYITGEATFDNLHNHIKIAWHYIHIFGPTTKVAEITEEWLEQARALNVKMSIGNKKIAERVFRKWLSAQL